MHLNVNIEEQVEEYTVYTKKVIKVMTTVRTLYLLEIELELIIISNIDSRCHPRSAVDRG